MFGLQLIDIIIILLIILVIFGSTQLPKLAALLLGKTSENTAEPTKNDEVQKPAGSKKRS